MAVFCGIVVSCIPLLCDRCYLLVNGAVFDELFYVDAAISCFERNELPILAV